jgi:hypothetical protein
MPVGTQVEQAARYLRMLLERPGEYRELWAPDPDPCAGRGIDYTAVARVLAPHDAGERRLDRSVPVDGLLTRTTRQALEGSCLSAEVLTRFVEAFALRRSHARRLTALLAGASTVRAVSRGEDTPVARPHPAGPPAHETLSLYESHVVGPDGLPAEHQTIQVIRSRVDGLTSLPYCFDTDELVVEVLRGGRVDDRVYSVGDGGDGGDPLFAVDILLNRPLAEGHTTLLRYHSVFNYRSAPAPELRRGVLGRVSDLTMWVRFHPDRLPRRVWLSRWDGIDQGRIIRREPVDLDEQFSAHHRFGAIERAVVGFSWAWE